MGLGSVARTDFGVRRSMMEAKFAGGRANHRFWLLVFNIFASVILAILLSLMVNVTLGVVVTAILAVLMFFVEIDKIWLRLIAWR